MTDAMNLAAVAGDGGKWLAVRLSDGGTDGVAYDTRREAIRHQLHETLCAYVRAYEITAREAETVLAYHRAVYDAGYRLPDPDDEPRAPLLDEGMIARWL
jgi:hypothetical protein